AVDRMARAAARRRFRGRRDSEDPAQPDAAERLLDRRCLLGRVRPSRARPICRIGAAARTLVLRGPAEAARLADLSSGARRRGVEADGRAESDRENRADRRRLRREIARTQRCGRVAHGTLRTVMGLTVLTLEVSSPAAPNRAERVEFLIDSGAIYSVVPRRI